MNRFFNGGARSTNVRRTAAPLRQRTGRYHQPQRAFAAGFETRIVHPFATKQYRQPVDPGNKTDDTDLAAIHRATVTGFALLESPATRPGPPCNSSSAIAATWSARVRPSASCQIRDHLEAALPGFAACFDKLWEARLRLAPAPRTSPPPRDLARRRT